MKAHWRRRNMFYRGYMLGKALFAHLVFGFPSKDIVCIGITGTDGKSTTSEMIYWILKKKGYKVGLLSTVHLDIGVEKEDNLTKLTSLSHRDFCKYMKKAKNNGLTHMVIEVSSHALYQYRIWPTKFSAVGFTNLTHEHLDFHRTMKHYFHTKTLLFNAYTKKSAVGIFPHRFSKEQQEYIKKTSKMHQLYTFGKSKMANIWVSDIVESPYLSCILHIGGEKIILDTLLLGAFNTENMMIATILTHALGVSLKDIALSLKTFPGLPGRQELVKSPQGVTVMIDFALTPDALDILYTACRSLGYNRLIAVFGATGERDQKKRPLMGEIATRLCDFVVLTEDENYTEDGKKIIKQIEQGISKKLRDSYTIVQDRTKAIEYAVGYAEPGDLVIVTGMANFTTRSMNHGLIPWNERAVIEKALRNKK